MKLDLRFKPNSKAYAAAIGGGFGGALSTILIYAFETLTTHDLPNNVENALIIVITALTSMVLTWLFPKNEIPPE